MTRAIRASSGCHGTSVRWKRPPIFDQLQAWGEVERVEMFSTFNMGLGMIAVVGRGDVAAALKLLADRGVQAWEGGAIEAAEAGKEAEAIIEP